MSYSAPGPSRSSKPEKANDVSSPVPFCYSEAQTGMEGAGIAPEQAAEERQRREKDEAFQRGREAGRQELRISVEEALSRNREQLRQVLGAFANERTEYYRRIEAEVVQLALAIARKILHREAQLDPRLLAGIVRVTLEKLDAGTKIDLFVAAHETTEWRHFFASQPEGAPVPEVHEDVALTPGECRIETSLGATDAGLEAQLKEIESGLLDLLAERPGENVVPKRSSAMATAAGRG